MYKYTIIQFGIFYIYLTNKNIHSLNNNFHIDDFLIIGSIQDYKNG